MNFLGTVDEINSNDYIVIRCETLPEINDQIFDSEKRKIGVVSKLFGPVECPYVSIKIENIGQIMKGQDLYFARRIHNGKSKRRNRRD